VGPATGLAWTAAGGDILSIDVTLMHGRSELVLTGHWRRHEGISSSGALLSARQGRTLGLNRDFIRAGKFICIFLKEPCPRMALRQALPSPQRFYSAVSGKPLPQDIAMTGEITLRGEVLGIGGLPEKLIAAKRHRLKKVLIPAKISPSSPEISTEVRRGLKVVPPWIIGSGLEDPRRERMKGIINATFVGGTVNPLARRGNPLPEVIFLGVPTSQVVLINCLLNQKKLARPAPRRENPAVFLLTRLRSVCCSWIRPVWIRACLLRPSALAGFASWIAICARRTCSWESCWSWICAMPRCPLIWKWLNGSPRARFAAVYALNKSDKLTRSKRADVLIRARRELTFADSGAIIPFSAQTREGRDEVWKIIESWSQKSA